MKKKILAAIFAATTMLVLSAMTAFAEVDVTYNFDSADELSGATITGAPAPNDPTVSEVTIEDGQLIMNSTYGILLPDVIDTTSYEVSYTVTYNSKPSNAGPTIFIGEYEPQNWIAFGFGNTENIGAWAYDTTSNGYSTVITEIAYEDGATYNVRFVVQEGNLTIYVNDVEAKSGSVPNLEGDKKVYIGVSGWEADTVDFKLDTLSIKTISGLSEEESQSIYDESVRVSESESAKESENLSIIQSKNAAAATTASEDEGGLSTGAIVVIVIVVVVVVVVIVAALAAGKKKKK